MKPVKTGADGAGDGVATPSNPGTSINFDAQALHDAEEAEYQREEHERLQEIHALLTTTNAFDDLSDEIEELDASQNSSRLSQTPLSQDGHSGDAHLEGDWQQPNWHPQYDVALTSTPANTEALAPPPLVSAQAADYPYGYPGNMDYPQTTDARPDGGGDYIHQGEYWVQGGPETQHPTNQGYDYGEGVEGQGPEMQQPPSQGYDYGERGEVEGATAEDIQYQDTHQGAMHFHDEQNYGYHDNEPADMGYHDNYQHDIGHHGHKSAFHEVGARDAAPHVVDQQQQQSWDSQGHHDVNHQHQDWEATGHHGGNQHAQNWSSPGHHHHDDADQLPASWDSPGHHGAHQQPTNLRSPAKQPAALDNYRVTYGSEQTAGLTAGQTAGEHIVPDRLRQDTGHTLQDTGHTLQQDMDSLQQEFLQQAGGSSETRQLNQLQILYKARGQQLQECQHSLQTLRDDTDRQIRILKHQLTLAQDEKTGAAESREQCQHLLTDSKQRESQLQGQVAALSSEINGLRCAKQELIAKLETAESNIETLNCQLQELASSESLTRAKDQHHSIVSGLKHKYEQEILTLKEKLDSSDREKEEQHAEISQLKKQLTSLTKAAEEVHIERADTINRLTRSLEDSQRQCQQLLEAGTGQEVGKLKLKLQDAIAGRSIAEDMNSALQDEIKELKEQVTLYESASQYGVYPGNRTAAKHSDLDPDDSYAQLGIKKVPPPVWKTPDNSMSELETLSSEETVHGLKQELERCLEMYRSKRQRVNNLQQDVKNLKVTLEETKHRLETVQREAGDNKEFLSDSGNVSVREAQLQREVDKVIQNKQFLQDELQEVKQRLEEVATSEERVNDLNRELSTQMSQMVREFDEDKRQALEKCQEACLKLHEDRKEQLKQELETQFEQNNQQYVKDQLEETEKLREELTKCLKELDEVKELYVNVCQVKDELEVKVNNDFEVKLQEQLSELKEALSREKEEEVAQLRQTLSSTSEVTIATAKDQWHREQEEETRKTVEAEIATARVKWFQEHEQSKDGAVETAVRKTEAEWQSKLQNRLSEELSQAKTSWQSHQQEQLETELAERLAAAKQTWTETELQQVQQDLQSQEDDRVEQAIETARDSWRETELRQAVTQAHTEWKQSQLQEEVARLQQCNNQELETLRSQKASLEKSLSSAEEALNTERQQLTVDKRTLEQQLSVRQEAWLSEKQEILRQKDTERREAVTEVQTQCEQDYKDFLEEHQNTLNNALKSARQQFAQEKEELEKRHEEEIKLLREKRKADDAAKDVMDGETQQAKWLEEKAALETRWQQERLQLETEYRGQVEACKAQHEEQKTAMMQAHRDNLTKALQEAKMKWRKKQEELASQGESALLLERERQWAEERADLMSELQDRDQLLQSADQHMEAEINKLQEDLNLAHQQQLEAQLNKLQLTHQEQLQQEQLKQQEQHSAAVRECSEERDKLVVELQNVSTELRETQSRFAAEVKDHQESIKGMEAQLMRVTIQLQEQIQQSKTHNRQKEDLETRLGNCEQLLDKAERQRQELVKNYAKAESEHNQIVESHRRRQQELSEKLLKLQKQYKMLDAKARKQVTSIQESLEREQTVAMNKMKEKMLELRTKHGADMEKLRKEHTAQLQELRQRQRQRDTAHTPTQTEKEHVETDALKELHGQYLQAVSKIKADVLQHSLDATDAVADRITVEVIKERQATARRLRKYYLRCYSQMLEKEFDSSAKAEKMAAMKEALDSIPERDSSCATTRNNTPGSDASDANPSDIRSITPIQTEPVSADGWVTPKLSKNSPRNRSASSASNKHSTRSVAGQQSTSLSLWGGGTQSWATTPEITPRNGSKHTGRMSGSATTPPTSSTPAEDSPLVNKYPSNEGLYFQSGPSQTKSVASKSGLGSADSSPASIERDHNYNTLNKTIDTLDREKTPTNVDSRRRVQCKSADFLRQKPRLTVAGSGGQSGQSSSYKYTSLRTGSAGHSAKGTATPSATRHTPSNWSTATTTISRGSKPSAAKYSAPDSTSQYTSTRSTVISSQDNGNKQPVSTWHTFVPVAASTAPDHGQTSRSITVISKLSLPRDVSSDQGLLHRPTPMVTRTTQVPSPVHVTTRPVNKVR